MIIHHQNNLSAFAGNHVVYWVGQPMLQYRIAKTSAILINILDFERGAFRGFARGARRGAG